jgi:hypothetical protein
MKKKFLILIFLVSLWSCGEEETTPTPNFSRANITRITINSFPTLDNGETWDNSFAGFHPDVYAVIAIPGTTTELYSVGVSNRIENLQFSMLPRSWSNSGTTLYAVTNLATSFDVDLYDYDSISTNQYMGTCTFNLSNFTSGSGAYPPSITITQGNVSITLDISWGT